MDRKEGPGGGQEDNQSMRVPRVIRRSEDVEFSIFNSSSYLISSKVDDDKFNKNSPDRNSPYNVCSSEGSGGSDEGQKLVFSPGNHEEAPCQICGIQNKNDFLR